MVRDVIVLGGGSAGLLAALALLRVPGLSVHLVRSPEIGIIGVGEGTTASVPRHLHGFLGLDPASLHREVRPTWKLGVRFLWGPRSRYHYTFTNAVTARLPGLRRGAGYHCWDDFSGLDLNSALMEADLAFARQSDGAPLIRDDVALHLENEAFVGWLERQARARGLGIMEATVRAVEPGGEGIAALHLEGGGVLRADLYVDASGFRGTLLREALGEPFLSYRDALFCDRAAVTGWDRTDEPLLPVTVAETMPAGWCWRIEHDERIHRGHVFSSQFLDDESAAAQLRAANPRAGDVRFVAFRTGRLERCWVGNVVAVGNAGGFVEPLEATALSVICDTTRMLASALIDSECRPGPELRTGVNRIVARLWDEIRDFLAVHYRFNTRLDTPFWRACREEVALHGAGPIVDWYRENGPSSLTEIDLLPAETSIFRLEGFFTHLLGQRVPHARVARMPSEENAAWQNHRRACRAKARTGMGVAEACRIVRGDAWRWSPGFYRI